MKIKWETLNPHYELFLLQKDPPLMGLLIRDLHREPGRMWGGDLSTSTDSKSPTSRPPQHPRASLVTPAILISVITSIIHWYSYNHSIWLLLPVSSWAEPSLVPWRGTNNLQVQAGETVILVNHNHQYLSSLLNTQTRWTETVHINEQQASSSNDKSDLILLWTH